MSCSPSSPIPIVQSDRGGQITYHGPGQLMVYLLLNLKNYDFHAKSYVHYLEQAIIALLKQYDIKGFTQSHAPGVYVYAPNDLSHAPALKKIASIGIRIRKNFSYHGICLNISSDLSPFNGINPCGYTGLGMAQLSDFKQTQHLTPQKISHDLTHYFKTTLEVR
jgi:lipoyl(octanoyl) transferase